MSDPDSPPARDSGASAGGDMTMSGRYVAGRDLSHVTNNITHQHFGPASFRVETPVFTLRRDIKGFVGRDDQLAEVERKLDPERNPFPLVCICNGAGCGKTVLALHAAHLMIGLFPDAQLFLEMSKAGGAELDTGEALLRLLRALGLPDGIIPGDEDDRAELFRRLLPRRSLLVLDNVTSARQIAGLLPGHRECGVLVTSRHSLTELEGRDEVILGKMEEREAFKLLSTRIGPARTAAEEDAARDIVDLCGRLPLALRIVAAQLNQPEGKDLSLAEYAGRLRDEQARLDELKADRDDLDVRASFELSYRALSPAAARLFRLLGWARVPGFSRGFVEAVDGTSDAPRAFRELVNAYLAESTGAGRYMFHDLLALFAREKADGEEAAERDAALDRAFAWCADRAAVLGGQVVPKDSRAEGTTTDRAELAALDAERDVVMVLLRRAAAEERDSRTPLITARLGNFFEVRDARADWLEAAELSLVAADRLGDPEVRAGALLQRSWPLRLMRKTETAKKAAAEALLLTGTAPASMLRAEILSHLGMLHRETYDYGDAELCLEEAIGIFRSAGDLRGEGLALRTLGHVQARRQTDMPGARATLERAIDLLQQAGDPVGEAWSRNNLCSVLGYEWRYDDAAAQAAAAEAIFAGHGGRLGRAWALNHMGRISLQYGRTADAVGRCDQALEIFRELRDSYGAAWAMLHLASARADPDLAREARDIFASMSKPEDDGQGWALVTLARLLPDASLADEALRHFKVVGSRRGQGTALAVRGDLERMAGNDTQARRTYDLARSWLDDSDTHQAALVQLSQAELAARAGDDDEARSLTRSARDTLTALGAPEATPLGQEENS